jgi:hypothetical protein
MIVCGHFESSLGACFLRGLNFFSLLCILCDFVTGKETSLALPTESEYHSYAEIRSSPAFHAEAAGSCDDELRQSAPSLFHRWVKVIAKAQRQSDPIAARPTGVEVILAAVA